MQYQEFLNDVRRRASLVSDDQAAAVTEATLSTLGECLKEGEREQLASQLPKEMKPFLYERTFDMPVDLESFYERVAARSGIGFQYAQQQVPAVLAVLRDAGLGGELQDALRQLPADYSRLFTGQV